MAIPEPSILEMRLGVNLKIVYNKNNYQVRHGKNYFQGGSNFYPFKLRNFTLLQVQSSYESQSKARKSYTFDRNPKMLRVTSNV